MHIHRAPEDMIYQCTFARAGDAGHAAERTQGELYIVAPANVPQIVEIVECFVRPTTELCVSIKRDVGTLTVSPEMK